MKNVLLQMEFITLLSIILYQAQSLTQVLDDIMTISWEIKDTEIEISFAVKTI